jgi:DNA processing protein
VLASGVDHPYPAGHADLFTAIAASGLIISEWPPASRPARLRFLTRNRVIAALSAGTVIIEAGDRSGALNTARHANDQHRTLMAVPGPVTSAQSAGCHKIIRDWNATLVTSTTDILAMVTPIGEVDGLLPRPVAPDPMSRDGLDLDSARVLDAFPARGAIGTSTIATQAGVELATVLRCIGVLAGNGFIEHCDQGWRLTRMAR